MLWQCLQSQISRHLEFCMNLQAFQQQQLFSSFVPLVDFLMLLPTSSRCSSLSPLSDEPLMDIQFSLGLGHPEIPKATHCMLTELTDYSTFSQTPSSLHTTRNTESSFKLSSTGFGTVKLLQWQHTPMQLYFKKSTGTDLPKLALTLYQKFTVMVIPPFRRDSMWCHLHRDSRKKNQKLLLQLIGKYLANFVCSNCIGQSWPYTSTTKTTELLMKSPYLNTDPFLAYVSREHTQQCVRITIPILTFEAHWPKLSQKTSYLLEQHNKIFLRDIARV